MAMPPACQTWCMMMTSWCPSPMAPAAPTRLVGWEWVCKVLCDVWQRKSRGGCNNHAVATAMEGERHGGASPCGHGTEAFVCGVGVMSGQGVGKRGVSVRGSFVHESPQCQATSFTTFTIFMFAYRCRRRLRDAEVTVCPCTLPCPALLRCNAVITGSFFPSQE